MTVETLLPPSASPLERALEQPMAIEARVRETGLDALWRPDACPPALLPYLAWSLGVRRWSSDWSVPDQRAAVMRAIDEHRRRGTAGAIYRTLDALGAIYDVVENPAGVRFTMRIAILNDADVLTDGAAANSLTAQIEDAKRLSVHVTLATAPSLDTSAVYLACGVAAVQVAQIGLVVDDRAAT